MTQAAAAFESLAECGSTWPTSPRSRERGRRRLRRLLRRPLGQAATRRLTRSGRRVDAPSCCGAWKRATTRCGPTATSPQPSRLARACRGACSNEARDLDELCGQHRPGHDRPARHGRLLARPGGPRRCPGRPRRVLPGVASSSATRPILSTVVGPAARGRLRHRLVEVRHDARAERALLLCAKPRRRSLAATR